jgi:hypothetical protein
MSHQIFDQFIPRKVSIADGEFLNQDVAKIFDNLAGEILDKLPQTMKRAA